jgi:hypothetical protein
VSCQGAKYCDFRYLALVVIGVLLNRPHWLARHPVHFKSKSAMKFVFGTVTALAPLASVILSPKNV